MTSPLASAPVAPPCLTTALEAITPQVLESRLELSLRITQPGMVAADLGPLRIVWKAVYDSEASLDEFTSREESPDLYAKADRGDLFFLGLIAEISVRGHIVTDAAVWAVNCDLSNATSYLESYRYLYEELVSLTLEAWQDFLRASSALSESLTTAQRIASGLEEPYHCSGAGGVE